MSTKEINKQSSLSGSGPHPVCGTDEHWDDAAQACVPNSGGQEVAAYSEADAEESKMNVGQGKTA